MKHFRFVLLALCLFALPVASVSAQGKPKAPKAPTGSLLSYQLPRECQDTTAADASNDSSDDAGDDSTDDNSSDDNASLTDDQQDALDAACASLETSVATARKAYNTDTKAARKTLRHARVDYEDQVDEILTDDATTNAQKRAAIKAAFASFKKTAKNALRTIKKADRTYRSTVADARDDFEAALDAANISDEDLSGGNDSGDDNGGDRPNNGSDDNGGDDRNNDAGDDRGGDRGDKGGDDRGGDDRGGKGRGRDDR